MYALYDNITLNWSDEEAQYQLNAMVMPVSEVPRQLSKLAGQKAMIRLGGAWRHIFVTKVDKDTDKLHYSSDTLPSATMEIKYIDEVRAY